MQNLLFIQKLFHAIWSRHSWSAVAEVMAMATFGDVRCGWCRCIRIGANATHDVQVDVFRVHRNMPTATRTNLSNAARNSNNNNNICTKSHTHTHTKLEYACNMSRATSDETKSETKLPCAFHLFTRKLWINESIFIRFTRNCLTSKSNLYLH